MKRIIVSGAGGFLGSNIIDQALQEGLEVTAITTREDLPSRVTVIRTEDFLEHGCAFDPEDVFINCLFPTNADGSKMADGLAKVFRLTALARESGVGAYINISSQSVYASRRTAPAREGDRLCLETPYAVGKYSSEAFTNQVFQDLPHTNIRMASLLGVGYDQRIVNRMADQAMKGCELKVVGGMQRYGFLDVRDAAAGLIMLAASNPAAWKEYYNLGRRESYSLIDVVECITAQMKSLTGVEIRYVVTEGEDHRNSAVDPSLFMEQYDWTPGISLSQTTEDIIKSKCHKADHKY